VQHAYAAGARGVPATSLYIFPLLGNVIRLSWNKMEMKAILSDRDRNRAHVYCSETIRLNFINGSEVVRRHCCRHFLILLTLRVTALVRSNTTFPGASLQSQTVGFPKSGFDLGLQSLWLSSVNLLNRLKSPMKHRSICFLT
jgi:hypothetical protein